jgi:pilus assembly protein CpaE
MRSVLARLVRSHEVVIVDCATVLNEATLAVLDTADEIICPIALDIPAIRSVRVFVDLTERLGYPESKLRLVINRADTNYGIRQEDVQRSVGRNIEHSVISDARAAVHALNHGVPFVLGNKRAAVSRDVLSIAESLLKENEATVVTEVPRMRPSRRLALARR